MIMLIVAILLVGGELAAYLYITRRQRRMVGLGTLVRFFALAFADALLLRLLAAWLGGEAAGWVTLAEAVMWLAGIGLVVSFLLSLFFRWAMRTDITDIPGADKSEPPVGSDDTPMPF